MAARLTGFRTANRATTDPRCLWYRLAPKELWILEYGYARLPNAEVHYQEIAASAGRAWLEADSTR